MSLANERLTLKTINSKVEIMASANKIEKIRWPLHDKIFSLSSLNDFKSICNETLKNLQIEIKHTPQTITNAEEKQQILEKYHSDELFGAHCGMKKLYAKI